MRLEAEFRVHLQRLMLEQALGATPIQPEFEPSTWVRLLEPPSDFSSDEALLLCQCSDDRWLAWVPDYGEISLHLDQFRAMS